jgi:oligoribonuclease
MSDRMVWVDCEMTGLDLGKDALIEIAVLVTDADLNVLGEGVDLVIRPEPAALETMPDIVREMHTASGLLDVLDSGITMAEAEQQALDYVRAHVPDPRKAPLAGSSVHTDRTFLARDMPAFEEHVHYRNVDVSTLKELARRWYPKVYFNSPPKTGNHRALGDIQDSINELRYYRSTLFVTPPGPDTDAARAAAATLTTG